LKENPDLSFVALESGKVVGYVMADTQDNDEAVLEDIAIAIEHQKRRIGTRLLEKELTALNQKGVKTVLAEVHYKCASAIPFYYKHGFRITGFKQDHFGEGQDAIILKLNLNECRTY
jgi:ribosomal-protein-alanine N-acetyltransferase